MRKLTVTGITRMAAVLATAASMLTMGLAMAPVASADTASTIQSIVQGQVGAQAHGRLSVASAATIKSTNRGPRNDPQGTVTQAQAKAIASASAASISSNAIESRAEYWVSQNIPYNQSAYSDANSAPIGPYRQDCSGFISMAWGLSSSLDTQTLPEVSQQLPSYSDLQLGDILDYNSTIDPVNGSHVVMFVSWANPQHTEYTEMEEAGGIGAVERTIQFPYDSPMDGSGTWVPYRYNNVVRATSPSVTALAGGGYVEAFQNPQGYLCNRLQSGTYACTDLQMMAGTSPSIAGTTGGGYIEAFQANTGTLWNRNDVGTAADTSLGMDQSSSPSVTALTGGGYTEAFQNPQHDLCNRLQSGTYACTSLGMMAGTSPSIAGTTGGGYIEAFQANTGTLWNRNDLGTAADTGLGMM